MVCEGASRNDAFALLSRLFSHPNVTVTVDNAMWTAEETSLRGVSRDFFANPCPVEDKLRKQVAARVAAQRFGKVVQVQLQGELAVRAQGGAARTERPVSTGT